MTEDEKAEIESKILEDVLEKLHLLGLDDDSLDTVVSLVKHKTLGGRRITNLLYARMVQ